MGSGRLLCVMLQGVVVFVPAEDDGCICAIYVIGLANTIAAAVSCTTHGIPCATLSTLAAGQTGASDIVAEFITSAVLIIRANT